MWFSRKQSESLPADFIRRNMWVHGKVQNVGFRWWVNSQAKELKLNGVARNLPDGRVHVVAEGNGAAVAELERRLQPETHDSYRPGRVDFLAVQDASVRGTKGFRME